MGLIASLGRTIQNATYKENEGWFAEWLRGEDVETGRADSGVTVNEKNALRISTVWKCVQWRANVFGMLPKKVYERVDMLGRQSQVAATSHPLYRIVHSNPNPTITSKAHFGLVSADLHLWGNSYAYIERFDNSARIRHLWRIRPDLVRIEVRDDELIYWVRSDYASPEIPFFADEILHIRGLGFDGIKGYSPIRLMMNTLGWNAAAVRYGGQFFKNASRPGGLVIVPAALKVEAKKSLIESLAKVGKEAGKLALIEGAVEYKSMTMPQDEAQFIETMQYQEEDIVGIMGVPQHKVQILRRSTNNNIEHQGIESVTDCIQPLSVEVEQWVNLQCLSSFPSSGRGGGTERDRFFMECELKGLLRGDTAAQTAHIEKMIDKGVYSQNDARDYLGLSPVNGGDTYWMNLAYGPLDKIAEMMTAQIEALENPPEPAAAPDDDDDDEPQNALRAEMQARIQRSYARIFRDAVGRTINRKDRASAVRSVFGSVLDALADAFEVELQDDFKDEYLSAMGKRAADWNGPAAEETTENELKRAVEALLKTR